MTKTKATRRKPAALPPSARATRDEVVALVSALTTTAESMHVSLVVFHAALFSLAASELARILEREDEPPPHVVALADDLQDFAASTIRAAAAINAAKSGT